MEENDLLAYVKAGLRQLGPKLWPAIADDSGKPLSTIRKIAYNNRKNPKLDTIQPIANAVRERLQ